MASPMLLRATGLGVGYADGLVVEGIDLEVGPGQSLALVGQNGSGKSTLLKTLAGLLPARAGDLEVVGEAPGSRPAEVAYLGQFHPSGLSLPLRVRDVVAMGRFAGLGLLRRAGPADNRAVDQALADLGIEALADLPLSRLSGGQRQRVFIAQALAREAKLLLFDEPSSGLDAPAIDTYRRLLREACGAGAAAVVATHDIEEAKACDLTLLLAGRVVAYGPSREVLKPAALLATFGILARYEEGGLVALGHDHCQDHDHGPEGGGAD